MQTGMKIIWMLKHPIKNVFICVWWGRRAIGDEELDVAIEEGTFAFHTVARNQSFQLTDYHDNNSEIILTKIHVYIK
jgi:hypothetical protein